MRAALPLLLIFAAACHPPPPVATTPAADGVRAYLEALRKNDPNDAYALMSADAKKKISPAEFALQWKQTEKERAWQAGELEKSIKGNPNVGERAVAQFSDGKQVELERDTDAWRLETPRFAVSHASQPRDAIRLFAEAIGNRDVAGVLAVLTQRRRDGLTKQIQGFIDGLAKRINDHLDEWTDRAELRWDEAGLRYRIILRKEEDEWRVDDISIRPSPKDEEPAEKPGIEGAVPEDF